jgi:hypothetical protein
METTTIIQGDPIWIEDYSQLIRRDKLLDVIPAIGMPFSERINAIVRASFYLGIIFMLLHNNYLYIYLPIIVMISTFLVYVYQSKEIKEGYRNLPRPLDPVTENPLFDRYLNARNERVKCVTTTIDNPFMNPLPADDRRRGPACPTVNNVELANKVEANFSNNLFKDINDIYNRSHSERQYYTVPSTTFANEQGKFAQWLYGGPPTCKEGNGDQCVANNHTRLNQASYKGY